MIRELNNGSDEADEEFGKTTTFGFDLDVSMKKDIEAITKKLNKEEERKYSKGDCIR